jgi:hypothetical protein
MIQSSKGDRDHERLGTSMHTSYSPLLANPAYYYPLDSKNYLREFGINQFTLFIVIPVYAVHMSKSALHKNLPILDLNLFIQIGWVDGRKHLQK